MTDGPRPTRSGEEAFRPRARIIRAIGEDLISNEFIAITELVKNAYDADAHLVRIEFESPVRKGAGALIVADDGHGMTLDVLKTAWLEPATPSKLRAPRSLGGRRVTGEKGLGRFAAARLADGLILESIVAGTRVVARVEWGAFQKEDSYLDQVRFQWEEYATAPDDRPGTRLRLETLHDDWSEASFRRLRAELARLVAPQRGEDTFTIALALPSAFSHLTGQITPPAMLARAHYRLAGSMSAEGHLMATGNSEDGEFPLDRVITVSGGTPPRCGPFAFEISVWNRDAENLATLAMSLGSTQRDLRRDLDEACGVSIYRDGFRVLPYGGADNDWLRLDLRRVQNPTMRLSNNQIVGALYIAADANPALRDQTNREGLVESQALNDLRDCVRAILGEIESVRYRSRRRRPKRDARPPLFAALAIEPIRMAFHERYPGDAEFLSYLDERAAEAGAAVDEVQEVLARYRRLATLGQLVDVVLHDGRTPVAAIANECDLARRDIQRAPSLEPLRQVLVAKLDTIGKQTEVLSSLLRRIAPFGGRKRGRPVPRPVEEMVGDAFSIYHGRLGELAVTVTLPQGSTLVTADPAEIQQILANLLDNAVYWLEKVPKATRAIVVQVRKAGDGAVEILFSDSGPGVPEEVRQHIFEPYFSTKPDGIGLGLTIAGETAAEYGGTLELVAHGALPGANFRVLLRRRMGEDKA